MPALQDSLTSGNGRLRLVFEQLADRVAHRLFAVSADGETLLLSSLEGSAAEAWPASPPLQSLLIEPRPNGSAVALLVGMAGKSHWSAAIEPREDGFHFDVACRVSEPPGFLGSEYRLAGGKLTVTPLEPATVMREGELIRVIAPPATHAGKQTVRWRYDLRVE